MIRDADLIRWLVIASAALSVAGFAVVLRDVRRPDGDPRQMKPQLVSWGVWAVLMAEGAVAALRAGQLPAGVYGLACAAGCAVIAALGWRDRSWGWLSRGCAAVAAGCLALMVAVSDPVLVIGLTVAADLAGYLPTIRHAWTAPREESWLGYGLYGLGAWAGVAVAAVTMTGMTYLAYLAVADTAVPAMILARRRAAGSLAAANTAATLRVLARVWPPVAAPGPALSWAPVTGLVWEAQPGTPAREPAAVASWMLPGPWVSPSGPLI